MTDETPAGASGSERTDGGLEDAVEQSAMPPEQSASPVEQSATAVEQSATQVDTDGQRLAGKQIFAVAAQEYRLSFRNRWALALTGLFALVAVLLIWFGGSRVGPASADAFVASLVVLSTYLLPLAALAFGYDAIVGPAENGWLDVVFALPVPRSRIVVGTYLGRAGTLLGATFVGFGTAAIALVARTGGVGLGTYAVFVLTAAGVGCAFLAIGVLISTLVEEKTRALGLALLTWVWFVLAHDLVALGIISAFDLPNVALSAMVLTNPADVFRMLVLSQLGTASSGLASVLAEANLSTSVLVGALVAWVVGPILLTTRAIRRVNV